MKYSGWLIFSFSVLFFVGCNSEHTYKDINLDDNIGLLVKNRSIEKTKLLKRDTWTPFFGVIHETKKDTSLDSLIIDKDGYPIKGKWKLYEGSILVEEGFYSDGKKDSVWTSYYSDGNIKRIENINKDVKNGQWASYYPGGEITGMGLYKNGVKQGKWIEVSTDYQTPPKDIRYDTLYYVDGVTEREIARIKDEERKRRELENIQRLENEKRVRNLNAIRENKKYLGSYGIGKPRKGPVALLNEPFSGVGFQEQLFIELFEDESAKITYIGDSMRYRIKKESGAKYTIMKEGSSYLVKKIGNNNYIELIIRPNINFDNNIILYYDINHDKMNYYSPNDNIIYEM